ncbi:MAG: hypothetical protein E6Q39_02790 [Crocinitomicaceae bacterium]|nr:MAG: hypothetical protein E6Q39_02790 [Crocinitomicaceae bacterium]
MVTWSAYLTTSVISLLVYYAGVLLIFFRKDISLSPRSSSSKEVKYSNGLYGPQSKKKDGRNAGEKSQLDAASAAPMHSLVDELQAFISQAGKDGMAKDDLHTSLKKLLQKYPSIKGSVFENGITNLISVTTENNCDAHFSADELRDLWV